MRCIFITDDEPSANQSQDDVILVRRGEIRIYKDTIFDTTYSDSVHMTSFVYQTAETLHHTITDVSGRFNCEIQKDSFVCVVTNVTYHCLVQ